MSKFLAVKISKEQYEELKRFNEKRYCVSKCPFCDISNQIFVNEISDNISGLRGLRAVGTFPSGYYFYIDCHTVREIPMMQHGIRGLDYSCLEELNPENIEFLVNQLLPILRTKFRRVLENDKTVGGCGSSWCGCDVPHIH